jgi:hypothetical protein
MVDYKKSLTANLVGIYKKEFLCIKIRENSNLGGVFNEDSAS